jgi:hypothetical protein
LRKNLISHILAARRRAAQRGKSRESAATTGRRELTAGLLLLMVGTGLGVVFTMYGPRALRAPMGLFNGLYILTTAIGATIIAFPTVRIYWALLFPGRPEKWLNVGESYGYWFLVWGPMLVTNLSAVILYPALRRSAVRFAMLLNRQVDVIPAACVGIAMSAYCFANLAAKGYLTASVLSGKSAGLYRENILLRVQIFKSLGDLHFACIYMGIPAIAMVALYHFAHRRSPAWLTLFTVLSGVLVFMYAATFTKSNVLIYGLEVTIGASLLGLIGFRGAVIAVSLGILTLSILTALLGGTDPLDLALAGVNIIFREASGVPYYLAIFPDQVPFTGIDFGLRTLGIGSEVTGNLIVADYMSPKNNWVQGSAAIAAHIAAYAQAGFVWSFVTMVAAGAWIAFSGQIRRIAHGAVVFSAFMGAMTTCYYLTQADFVGAFNVTYGYKWWLAALFLLIGMQNFMQQAMRPTRQQRSVVDARPSGS